MREILFRGKRIDNGEWVDGNFYESGISGVFILQNKTRKTIDAKTGEIALRDEPIPFEVLPSTIGQYTGLKDKHGKRIFENGYMIIDKQTYKVLFDNGEYILKNIFNCDIIQLKNNSNIGVFVDEI